MSAPFPTTTEGAAADASAEVPAVTWQLGQSAGSYELVLSGVILGLGGFAIDRWLGTTPIFLLVFTVLGVAGATISLYYRYRHQIATLEAETSALREARREATTARRPAATSTVVSP